FNALGRQDRMAAADVDGAAGAPRAARHGQGCIRGRTPNQQRGIPMNAPSEVPLGTHPDREPVRPPRADSAPGADFDEPRQSPNAVRPPLVDDATFPSFADGAGI